MTKRILSLFLVCILAIPIVAVPVSASSYDDGTWDEVDYLRGIFQRIVTIGEMLRETFDKWLDWMPAIRDQLALWESGMHSAFSALGTNISSYLTDLGDHIGDALAAHGNAVVAAVNEVRDKCITIANVIGTNFTNFAQNLLQMWQGFHDDMKTKWNSYQTAIETRLQNLHDEVYKQFVSIRDKLSELINGNAIGQENANQFQEDSQNQQDEIGEMVDILDEPIIDEGEFDDFMEEWWGTRMDASYSSFFSAIANELVLLTPLLASSVFAVIGFLLFGGA